MGSEEKAIGSVEPLGVRTISPWFDVAGDEQSRIVDAGDPAGVFAEAHYADSKQSLTDPSFGALRALGFRRFDVSDPPRRLPDATWLLSARLIEDIAEKGFGNLGKVGALIASFGIEAERRIFSRKEGADIIEVSAWLHWPWKGGPGYRQAPAYVAPILASVTKFRRLTALLRAGRNFPEI